VSSLAADNRLCQQEVAWSQGVSAWRSLGTRVSLRARCSVHNRHDTLDTSGPTFAAFLLGVIIIVGGLIYFPMLILGPIGERIIG